MKSLLSLIAALLVALAIAIGARQLYQQNAGGKGSPGVMAISGAGDTSLTLKNDTQFVLTATMTAGTSLVRFQLAPRKSQTQTITPGTYNVEGNISDPSTTSFSSQWTFKAGGKYNANFVRGNGQGAALGLTVWAGGSGATPNQTNPSTANPSKLRKLPSPQLPPESSNLTP
jgi:hypothetical protein